MAPPVNPDGLSGTGTGSSAAGPRPGGRRPGGRSRRATVVVLLFALAEVVAVIAVGEWIGALWTILLLVALSALGVAVLAHEGTKALATMREAARSGVMPADEVADTTVVTAAGLLLVLPGFITAAIGLILLLPFTRPLSRKFLSRRGPTVVVMGTDGRVVDANEVVEGEILEGEVMDDSNAPGGRPVIDVGHVDVTIVDPEDDEPRRRP